MFRFSTKWHLRVYSNKNVQTGSATVDCVYESIESSASYRVLLCKTTSKYVIYKNVILRQLRHSPCHWSEYIMAVWC